MIRQSTKNQNYRQSNDEFNPSSTYELDQNILDIPLKKSKQISQMMELQGKQQKILHKMDSKHMRSITQNSFRPTLTPTSQKQQYQSRNSKKTSLYIMGCIMRSFICRKLSIENIAQIFCIQPDLVEQVDKYRILKDFDSGNQNGNPKLEAMKMDIWSKLEQSLGGASVLKSDFKGLKSQFPRERRKRANRVLSQNDIIEQQQSIPQPPKLSSVLPPPFFQHTNQFAQDQSPFPSSQAQNDIFEYQRLLRQRPPYRLDNKIIALVDILKMNREMTQKDMLKVLEEEYGIKDMNQAAISRAIKRIYEMKKKVTVLLQAQQDGHVDLQRRKQPNT